MMILEPEIHDPMILSLYWSRHGFETPALVIAWTTKFACHPFQQALHLAVIVRYGFVSYHVRERGGLRHSPMSFWNPPPGAALGVGLQDVLAVPLVELVEVLELGGLERQVVGCERHSGTHHHKLGLEVLHHERKEVIRHFMKLPVVDSPLMRVAELVAHGGH